MTCKEKGSVWKKLLTNRCSPGFLFLVVVDLDSGIVGDSECDHSCFVPRFVRLRGSRMTVQGKLKVKNSGCVGDSVSSSVSGSV